MCKQPNRRQVAGITLAEMIVALLLVGFLLVLGLNGLRISPTTGRTAGLAQELKNLFAQARARAVANGQPVAIVFPTGNGATPVVTECDILSGTGVGKVDRHLEFRGNYPNVGIFIGEWALPAGMTFAPPEQPPSAEASRFSATNWMPPALAGQAAYFFLPSGEVLTQGQNAVNGEFPLVVASGLGASPGSGAGKLSEASDAYTVLVSNGSTSRIQKGVLGGDVPAGGTDASGWTLATLANPAPAPTEPVVISVEVIPAPVDSAFAAVRGAECIVQTGGLVTLRVKASDMDGGPLFCHWTSVEGGAFSHQGEMPMLYEPESGWWVAEGHWMPPATAVPDDIFHLNVTVRDEKNVATYGTGVVTTPRVLVVDPGILAFSTYLNYSLADPKTRCHVFAVKYDGTDLRAVAQSSNTGGFEGGMSPSRDGRRIAIGSDYGDHTLKLISTDGAEVKEVIGPDRYISPCFSADSNRIYAMHGNVFDTHTWNFVMVAFDAAGNSVETPSPFPGLVAGWSPDGSQALVQSPTGDVLICQGTDIPGSPAGSIVSTVYSSSEPGGPAIALDWNSSGIFYGNAQTEPPFVGQLGLFDVYKTDATGATPQMLGQYRTAADIGGNGRYIFHVADGIRQEDLTTGSTRLILPAFVEEKVGGSGFNFTAVRQDLYHVVKGLSASI